MNSDIDYEPHCKNFKLVLNSYQGENFPWFSRPEGKPKVPNRKRMYIKKDLVYNGIYG